MKEEFLTDADIDEMVEHDERTELTMCSDKDKWCEPEHKVRKKNATSSKESLQKKRLANAARQRKFNLKAKLEAARYKQMAATYAEQIKQQKDARQKIIQDYNNMNEDEKKVADKMNIKDLIKLDKIKETELWYQQENAKLKSRTPKNIADTLRRQLKLEQLRSARLADENAKLRKMPKGKPNVTLANQRANAFNHMLELLIKLDDELSESRKLKLSGDLREFFFFKSYILDDYVELKYPYNVWKPKQ